MTEQRVKIINADVQEKYNLVYLLLKDLSPKPKNPTFTQAWLITDFLSAVGIEDEVSTDILKKFFKDITGKEINLVTDSRVTDLDASFFKDASSEQMDEMHQALDEDPFYEVLMHLRSEEIKLRLFGTDQCENCIKMMTELEKNNINFDYIDVAIDETQPLCDNYDVNDLPRIQIIDNSGELMFDYIGLLDAKTIKVILKKAIDGTLQWKK